MDIKVKSTIQRFMNDPVMASVVESRIRHHFLKPRKNQDIHLLAGAKLASDFLTEAFNEFRIVAEKTEKTEIPNNPAV